MKIDLLHNKIVMDTITESFIASFMDGLVPLLEDKYGESLIEIQMYEDYLNDGFVYEGEFYYPLTLVFEQSQQREWIKWSIAEKKRFADGVPYSYIGKDMLNFEIADDVPEEFEEKLVGRGIYFEGGYIPFSIESPTQDKLFLVGKYSQTFIDEMTRCISREIEKAFSISGIADSTVKLSLNFAPGTFMEHIVDGITYRRLLISARGCSPRDLWIKWTNKNDACALTISDNVCADCVEFELGEEVPNKIREKEYRYLVRTSADKYQSAMGRKNITEWRDLIKRVIKRGEVEKIDVVSIDSKKSSELTFKLQEVLGFSAVDEVPAEEFKGDDNSDIAKLLKGVLGEDEDEIEADANESVTLSSAIEESFTETAVEEEPEMVAVHSENDASASEDYETELRRRIEAELRQKLELEAKMKAEEEAESLRRAHEELKAENERLAELARKAEQERLATEAAKEAEAERLRIEIEARERAEAREKERMAEAARIALIEQQKIMEERQERERLLREQQEREREEQKKAAEEARLAEQKRAEEERIRAEMKAREAERLKAAEAERAAAAASKAEENKKAQPTYTYVSKVAKLLFRYPIDPNVTKRIHEIILTTIKYFHKEDVYIKIRATVPDNTTVHLHFEKIPAEENELLVNIIKVLGKSDLGITKVYLE